MCGETMTGGEALFAVKSRGRYFGETAAGDAGPMLLDALLRALASSRGADGSARHAVTRTGVFDVETMEPVAVLAETEATGAAETSLAVAARLLLSRSVRAVPVVTRARLDDPGLGRAMRSAGALLAGSTRAKRLVVALRADSGSIDGVANAADVARRSGLELALWGEPERVLTALPFAGRPFAAVIHASTKPDAARRLAAAGRRDGVPLLVTGIDSFVALRSALAGGARYVAGPALESRLRDSLVGVARADLGERGPSSDAMRASEEEISRVRLAVAGDPETRDLAELTQGLVETVAEARRDVHDAERVEEQARAMRRVAEADLGRMLEGFAAGNAERAERLLRCEVSFLAPASSSAKKPCAPLSKRAPSGSRATRRGPRGSSPKADAQPLGGTTHRMPPNPQRYSGLNPPGRVITICWATPSRQVPPLVM